MVPPPQDPNANSQAPAGQSICGPEGNCSPFTHARVPGGFEPIPQHIRPFLDTTHVPTEGGFVPNRRPDTRGNVDTAKNHYHKLRRLSPVRHPATNRILSAYSGVELKPGSMFAGHQFDEYIFHAARKGRLFMFRVEKQASLMGHRHPRGLESTNCRFAKCPINGTIRPGQIRVCISEFLDPKNIVLDPYHNAAYVHLYCLETFCNLPSLLAEINVTFLPADQLVKESSYPPALNPAEREACLQWAHEARQSWKDFKRAHPIAEARPRYKSLPRDRLYSRLEAQKVTNKRPREDEDGLQAYTFNQVQRSPAPEPAPKKPRTVPPRIQVPSAPIIQIRQGGPGLPYKGQPPTSHPREYSQNNGIPINAPLPPAPGHILSGLAEGTETQPRTDGAGAPSQYLDYSAEEIGSLMAHDFVSYLGSALEEFPWHEPAAPPAAGPQEGTTPEQGAQPEQAPQPVQAPQAVASVKIPVATEGRRRSRRSSAPPALAVHNAKVRKSSAVSRRASKTRGVPVADLDLEELHKGRQGVR